VVLEEVAEVMTRRRSFREERARAARALLSYLGDPCPSNERLLLDAAHDLEAAASVRRLGAVSQRRDAASLRFFIATH
jgi:hypothetical protein